MPNAIHGWPVAGLWLAWLGYWVIAARNVKDERRRETLSSRLTHQVPLLIGAVLLGVSNLPLPWLNERFLPRSWAAYWIGLVLLAAGLAFAAWARVHLGRNWSSAVTLKQDHELVRSGPYGLVRHPIYTGLLLAILATAILVGEWRGLIAVALMTVSLLIKLRMEERFMDETFGADYGRYRRDVPALIPRLFRTG
jgi:protein-S-isoprenylcysteine O-methyltransferase Ste14